MILQKRQKYLQIALNSTLAEAKEIISHLPVSPRLLIEAGTPLIKISGMSAVERIKDWAGPASYVVADLKTADLAPREVALAQEAGAAAAVCLGVAPFETIDLFVQECQRLKIDSMVDMMNVENPLLTLKRLKMKPDVVVLHRGVDETKFSKEKQIPYYQIQQLKGNLDCLVAVAGGDTLRELQRAIFNDADIVVVWKEFYQASSNTAQLAEDFLNEIK
jgi:bifunctional enzyme Fae/Hps